MTRQDHGRDAFVALLREAAAGTEAPLRAWGCRLGKLVRTALPGVIAVPEGQAACLHRP